jgi:endonuclease YncB( thermonuclease family)
MNKQIWRKSKSGCQVSQANISRRWYRKHAPGHPVLEGLEKEAREERKGLWVDPEPVPPWEFR